MDRAAPFRRGGTRSRLGEDEDKEGEKSVEEEGSEETEVVTSLAGAPEAPKTANTALSNETLVFQAEQNFPKMMEKMAQLMGQLTQAASPRDNLRAPALKNPSMKAPGSFDDTQAHKLRVFIQSCQLIFHNGPENIFSDRKKVLYSTSFLTGRAGKWIEQYLSNIFNEDPSYLLNSWKFFETKLFNIFGYPNKVRKSNKEFNNLRMKKSCHLSLYIAYFRSLISRIGDWVERAYIHVYKRGLA
ncbi:hypothetical protein O181_031034 [Austropuccinia psidii MF-1]|uniref:Retrotransposon gag domain-containing protein n=1 Tax=Austropuccinia psidii MF-1 TaxID=1389203 RepID=A0A9Q3H645_9BASI|nr:hypothetical protein [Austropuccinia psidii MF-1]